jgi:uncharacterized membrane protein YdbT with pleckstrin-like domain
MPGESVVATAKLHWIIFRTPAILILFSIVSVVYCGMLPNSANFWVILFGALAVLLVALADGARISIWQATSEYAVTNKRVLVKIGLIRRDSLELLLTKIEAIGVNQSILGRLLGYGTLSITVLRQF